MQPDHLSKMEDRLEKGDQLCRAARGPEAERLTAFWLNLLREYEAAYRRWQEAGR